MARLSVYAWDTDFEPLDGTSLGWAHHGVAVTHGGRVVAFAPEGDALLLIDAESGTSERVPCSITEAHDISPAVADNGEESLWIADCGFAMCPVDSGDYELRATPGRSPRVVRVGLDGEIRARLPCPDIDAYKTSLYVATSVAVAPSGDIWVADGYGASLVHRFDADGTWRSSLDGSEGAGRFDCPHALLVHDGELFVADREKHRVQVFDLDGRYLRSTREGILDRPASLAMSADGHLVVAELTARLTILSVAGDVVHRIGHDPHAPERDGWPNALDAHGHPIRPPLRDGAFNSPHGVVAGPDGTLYVCEWLIGGRVSRLTRSEGDESGLPT